MSDTLGEQMAAMRRGVDVLCNDLLDAYRKATPEQRQRLHDSMRAVGISAEDAATNLDAMGQALRGGDQ